MWTTADETPTEQPKTSNQDGSPEGSLAARDTAPRTQPEPEPIPPEDLRLDWQLHDLHARLEDLERRLGPESPIPEL